MNVKKYSALLLLPLMLLLTACMTHYSVTESELDAYLTKKMTFEKQQGNDLLGMKVQVVNSKVSLGAKPGIMGVTATANVDIHNPVQPISSQVHIAFEAKPWYDPDTHSVYLKQLKLIDVSVDQTKITNLIKPLSPQLLDYLTQFLSTQPVYVLDTADPRQAIIAKMATRLEVEPGKLSLYLND